MTSLKIPSLGALVPDIAKGRRFLEANPPRGRVLLVGVTGAHTYGFPSADSDLDLKGIHIAPTAAFLGLGTPHETHDKLEIFEDLECDLTTHEARKALKLLFSGNGNMLERILSPFQLVESDALEALQAIAKKAISKRFVSHYRGFFKGMQREHGIRGTTKTMLYSLRVPLTGAHLLKTGELCADVRAMGPEYGFGELVDALVSEKRNGEEKGKISPALDERGRAAWSALETLLDETLASSALPSEPENVTEAGEWLTKLRLASL